MRPSWSSPRPLIPRKLTCPRSGMIRLASPPPCRAGAAGAPAGAGVCANATGAQASARADTTRSATPSDAAARRYDNPLAFMFGRLLSESVLADGRPAPRDTAGPAVALVGTAVQSHRDRASRATDGWLYR